MGKKYWKYTIYVVMIHNTGCWVFDCCILHWVLAHQFHTWESSLGCLATASQLGCWEVSLAPTQLANYWIICTSDNKLGLRKLLTVNLYDARRKEKSITFFLHEVTFGGSKFSSLMFLWPMTLTWPPLPTFYLWNNSVLHHYLRICSWSGAHFPDFHTWDSLLGCLVSAWLGH